MHAFLFRKHHDLYVTLNKIKKYYFYEKLQEYFSLHGDYTKNYPKFVNEA